MERYHYNPHGLQSFLYHTRLDMDESHVEMGFVYLQSLARKAPSAFGQGELLRIELVNEFGWIQFLFWLAATTTASLLALDDGPPTSLPLAGGTEGGHQTRTDLAPRSR